VDNICNDGVALAQQRSSLVAALKSGKRPRRGSGQCQWCASVAFSLSIFAFAGRSSESASFFEPLNALHFLSRRVFFFLLSDFIAGVFPH